MYVPLNVHSQYSVLNSSATLDGLVAKAKSYGMPALALTDSCNMYGAVDFFKAAQRGDLKAIVGLEMMLSPTTRCDKKRQVKTANGHPVTLLAMSDLGYRNLCKITSCGFVEGFYYTPRIDKAFLKEHSEGLICLSGSTRSRVAEMIDGGDDKALRAEIAWYQEVFGDNYYLEVQRHSMSESALRDHGIAKEAWLLQKYESFIAKQERVFEALMGLSKELSIPAVATGEVMYLEPEDFRAQEILMNVGSGEPVEIWERDSYGVPKNRISNPKRTVLPSHEFYFKSPEMMAQLFADAPEVLSTSLDIAKKCQFEFDFKKQHYPVFTPPNLHESQSRKDEAALYLRSLCEAGIPDRYTPERLKCVEEKYPGRDPMEVVRERLDHELETIISKGLCDYLLIVHDFIAWAKQQGIPVGPGRGSGVGAITLYLIGITDIEPLRFNLFFERFINPERPSYPDIDVDICMDRRSEVIEYTLRKYGRENVAQIITFGTMKAKMAIKDVGRVLSVPLVKVNAIAKLVPDDLNITIEKALEGDPDFASMYEEDPEARRVIDLARKLEGSIRNTGIHAAGIIICGDPLTDHIPVCNAKDSEVLVTQYAMKPVETVGMLKIDFLGLKTLTSIQRAADAVKKSTGEDIDWVNLPLDNTTTFDLLNHGRTSGIFQLESSGMQDLARQLHIDKFEEVIAVGALYRPGPMEMIPSFVARKHGREKIELDHERMKEILLETYGIIVYQEQVMQIAQVLGGFSLGEGDMLRRAMGKKDKEEMSRQGEKFAQGAQEEGIDPKLAMTIFDKVEKFASYGFNKSHATAYAYLTYVTAFFKANYPRQWMAALMTCDMTDIGKVAKHIRECQSMEIAILSPDVNESDGVFVATEQGVRFALSAIRGVGEGVVESIVNEREESGDYQSLYDFIKRLDPSRVGKRVVETLVDAGAFDFTRCSRKGMQKLILENFDALAKEQKERAKGIMDMFAAASDEEEGHFKEPTVEEGEFEKLEILKREKELLGFYLTGHPLTEYKEVIDRLDCTPIDQFEDVKKKVAVKAVFVVETCQVRISNKTQKKFAILTISNGIERFELPVWPELFAESGHLLDENQILVSVMLVEKVDGDVKLQCRYLADLGTLEDEQFKAIEEAYSGACSYAKMRARPKKEAVKVPEETKRVTLKLDIDKTHLSDIMKLKKLFNDFGGDCSVCLDFGEGVEKLLIESAAGISFDESIKNVLMKMPNCQSVELTE